MNLRKCLDNPALAVNGGKPLRIKKWFDNFTTGEEEKKAVCEVLDSGYLSLFEGSHTPDAPFSFWGGPKVRELEDKWCEYYNVKYAVSMSSATSGLYASIGALGIGFGDEVIVSPYTMTACAAAPLIYGAIPIFADVLENSGSLDPVSVEKNITKNTKAILVVHQFGIPAKMDELLELAKKYNLKIIEDCAQAHGAKYKGKYVGTIGDIGVFSMNVNKTIQSGEGAVVVTNDEELRYRLALIRNHGEAVVGPAGYENITNIIGFNYRLSELHAAVIIEQLKKLDMLNEHRLELVEYLKKDINSYEFFKVMDEKNVVDEIDYTDTKSTYYVFPIRFLGGGEGVKREELVKAFNEEGALFYQGYTKPLYLQPVYQTFNAFKFSYPFKAEENKHIKTNYFQGSCPVSERLYSDELIINEHIRFPHEKSDIIDIINIFKKIF